MSPTEAAAGGDFGQSHPWSEDLKEHLAKIRQGHVIGGIPVFFGSLGADHCGATRGYASARPDPT